MKSATGGEAEDDILSLRHHLVNWLFTPLYLLLLFSTVTGYIAALQLSNQPYDLVLTERARLLASRFDLTTHDEAAQPDLLLPDGASHLRFTLFDAQGRVVLGNARLPHPRPRDLSAEGPVLRNTTLSGEKVRLLVLHFRSTRRAPGSEFVLVVSEPVRNRLVLGRSILGNIVIPQFIFILIAGLAVWIGLKRGFAPLEQLRQALARRPLNDPSPIDASQAPGEVRPLILELNRLIERLRAMLEQQRRFVANAAHQLRTPFAGLRAQAELAKREPVTEPVRRALEGICISAGRCNRLVEQLLTLARNDPDAHSEATATQNDLNRVAQDLAMEWAPEAVRQGIDLGFEGAGRPLLVDCNEGGLRDMIGNLIDNAIRYTPGGGRITVLTGATSAGTPWLRVEDSGPGIPVEERTKVFDRFYRVAGSGKPGSGLGLAIVAEVAERCGARVEIGETLGGGAAFRVDFMARTTRKAPAP